jgi:hypothetical protein
MMLGKTVVRESAKQRNDIVASYEVTEDEIIEES